MPTKIKILFALLSLASLQIACAVAQSQPTETVTPTPSSTPIPTRVPTATPTEQIDVLFYDDFSQMDSAWVVPRSNTVSGDLHLSGFRLTTSAPGVVYWLEAGDRVEDMRVEVDAQLLVGGETSEIGLMCRYLSDSDFYAATINGAGIYTIYKLRARNWVQLAAGEVQLPTSGLGNVHLTLDCIGEVLAFFINEQLITMAYDSEFRLGKGGLFIYSGSEENGEFVFDDFYVRVPPEDSPANSSEGAHIPSEVIAEDLELAGFTEDLGNLAWEFTNAIPLQLSGENYVMTWQQLDWNNRYRDFILAFDVAWESTTGLAGCGAIMRTGNQVTEAEQIRLETWRFSGLPSWGLEYVKFNRHYGWISGELRPNNAIRQGNGSTNHYVIVANGPEFTVYVNGMRLGSGRAPEALTQGKLALFAWQESGQTKCTFSNVWVWKIDN
ncbi:MAG: hypothetical protein KIT08_02845 [Anaerolineales bacterium]|nr:MAG: hypothetical protein KIT08_02845 [Anaerolineales bacterium]